MSILRLISGYKNTMVLDGSWNNPRYFGPIIKREAPKFSLDPVIVAALVLWESEGGIATSTRWEPGFYKTYIHGRSREELGGHWPKWSTESDDGEQIERLGRAISYGHGQLMGQTAREFGFDGEFFIELCDPEINIPLACKKLSRCFLLAEKKNPAVFPDVIIRHALSYYNGGGDPNYPNEVLEFRSSGQAAEVVR